MSALPSRRHTHVPEGSLWKKISAKMMSASSSSPRPIVIPASGTESATGIDRWSPQLRCAVMMARPAFFTWSAEDQLRYRVSLPDEDREAIVAALLREHGERRPVALAKLESRGRVPLDL
jgi:hypothetical protein